MSSAPPPPSAPTPPADWELTVQQLRATADELQRRKADAEKDRELFRELYNKASAHAGDVSRENDALLERAARAEGQVRDGLAMVRETYEAHVRRLEDKLAKLRGLNAILTAKRHTAKTYLGVVPSVQKEVLVLLHRLAPDTAVPALEAWQGDQRLELGLDVEGGLSGLPGEQVGEGRVGCVHDRGEVAVEVDVEKVQLREVGDLGELFAELGVDGLVVHQGLVSLERFPDWHERSECSDASWTSAHR